MDQESSSVFLNLIIESRRSNGRTDDSSNGRPASTSLAAVAIRNALGTALRELRKLRGLTQEELAHNASVNPKFYGEIERGIRQPTIAVLCKLACALAVQPSELVRRMEEQLG